MTFKPTNTINLPISEAWFLANGQHHKSLDLSQNSNVKIFPNLSLSILEIVLSLGATYPHKSKVILVTGAHPEAFFLRSSLMQLDINLITRSYTDLENLDSEIDHETLLTIIPLDHAVTLERINGDKIEQTTEKSGGFTVCYGRHFFTSSFNEPNVRTGYLLVDNAMTVGVFGKRFEKIKPVVTHLFSYPAKALSESSDLGVLSKSQWAVKRQILEFESNLSNGLRPYFTNKENRFFNTSTIISELVDSEALMYEFGNECLSMNLLPPEMIPSSHNFWNRMEVDKKWLVYRTEDNQTDEVLSLFWTPSMTPKPYLKALLTAYQNLRSLSW